MGKATVDRNAILAALPATRGEIMRKTGVLERSVTRHLDALKADDKCFIGGWKDIRRGPLHAIYYPGKGKDMPMPSRVPRLSFTENALRYRTKARKTGAWDRQLQKRRERHAAKRQRALAAERLWAAPLFSLLEPIRPYY